MSSLPSQCYVDAPGWPDTVTVTQTYHYTSPDGKTTTTGSATFTYTRTRLADQVGNPKLPCTDYTFLQNTVDAGDDDESSPLQNRFLAVSSALGFTPGWVAVFGAQDPKAGAFTRTTTPDGGQPPVVTKLDATCDLSALCALVAPGFRTSGQDSRTLLYPLDRVALGINSGVVGGDLVDPAAFEVDLVVPGVPADDAKKQAAIPPVYRVSLPTDANLLQTFSLVVNGSESNGYPNFYFGTGLPGFIQGAFSDLGDAYSGVLIESITPWSCDVQMANDGDTLEAGRLAYYNTKPLDSSLTASPGGTWTISNPFPMTGQTFTLHSDDTGLSIEVTW